MRTKGYAFPRLEFGVCPDNAPPVMPQNHHAIPVFEMWYRFRILGRGSAKMRSAVTRADEYVKHPHGELWFAVGAALQYPVLISVCIPVPLPVARTHLSRVGGPLWVNHHTIIMPSTGVAGLAVNQDNSARYRTQLADRKKWYGDPFCESDGWTRVSQEAKKVPSVRQIFAQVHSVTSQLSYFRQVGLDLGIMKRQR